MCLWLASSNGGSFVYFITQSNSTISANNRMNRKQEDMLSFRCWRKTQMENQYNPVVTENPIHVVPPVGFELES